MSNNKTNFKNQKVKSSNPQWNLVLKIWFLFCHLEFAIGTFEKSTLCCNSRFLLDDFFKYLHIVARVLIDEALDLLGREFGEFGVHLKILNPYHLNTLGSFNIKPDNLHEFKRKHRLMARGNGKAVLFIKPALGNPALSLIVGQAKGDFIPFSLQDFGFDVFLAEKFSPPLNFIRYVKYLIIRCIYYY